LNIYLENILDAVDRKQGFKILGFMCASLHECKYFTEEEGMCA
jgi:hypothetical protein